MCPWLLLPELVALFSESMALIERNTWLWFSEISSNRLDDIKSAGKITEDLITEIISSNLCIADLTGNNPNVMWEVGYAHVLKKPIVIIRQGIGRLPFDVRDVRIIRYDVNDLSSTLVTDLAASIRDTMIRYKHRIDANIMPLPENKVFAIAVTGFMLGRPEKCRRRVESSLFPYLGDQVVWYIGSNGMTDETIASFLIAHVQKIIVVGYHSHDISENMLNIIEENSIPFVSAQNENLLDCIDAPTQRDLLFSLKANLIVLIWNKNSNSQRIEALVRWYEKQKKDYLLSFV